MFILKTSVSFRIFNRIQSRRSMCCGAGTFGNYFGNDSSSNYNALQVKLDKRFSQGLQFQANYTWSKAFNHSNDSGFLYSVDPRELRTRRLQP